MPEQWNAALKHLPTRYGTLAYFEFGSGHRPLLLLHGFPDTPQTFESLVEAACHEGYRCLAPLLPGYGDSDLPHPGGASILAVGRMLNDFLGHVATHQAVRIVGHDWGSILTQMLCGLHQEGRPLAYRIERVVLAAVPPLRTFLRQINPRQLLRSRYIISRFPALAHRSGETILPISIPCGGVGRRICNPITPSLSASLLACAALKGWNRPPPITAP